MTDRIKVFNLRQSTEGIGGAEVVIRRVVSLLDKSRFDVSVTCLYKPHLDLSAVRTSLADTGAAYHEVADDRIIDLKTLRQLRRTILKQGVQILHCHDPKTDLYGRLLKPFLPGVKLVSTLHGWVTNSRKGAFYKKLDIRMVRTFDRVIAVSPLILEEAQAMGIKQAGLIRNGIHVDEFLDRVRQAAEPPIAKGVGERWVGFVGRATAEKGPLDFVRLAQQVLPHVEKVRFVMIGEGDLLEDCRALAKELDLGEGIQFLGQVPFLQMPSIFANLDLLVSTSVTEGLPNVLLEGAAAGIPLVATDVGGCGEVVRSDENGYLEAYGAWDLMAERVRHLLDNPDQARAFGEAGIALVKRELSMQQTVSQIESLYEDLVR